MPRKALDLATHAERIAAAWGRSYPAKTFSDLTLEQFRATFKPCRDVRVELTQQARERKRLLFRRQQLDDEIRPILQRIVHAVRADPEVGENSAMYSSMGYVPKYRRRKPGRKRKTASPPLANASTSGKRQAKRRSVRGPSGP
jgi:hypothetical protein